ncbi:MULTISPECIES: hypothetical protein [unclassified Fusibacter]|uniref:DUF6937 domain-containing protein n=1 Tax=unclassified Fusibacter TaxID=2624464 RepID=UPI0010138AFE|nr:MULTISPECIES: hypothetical protein [unclassified Fusibacter]MCK8060087.1 hypothetical protein [Fusibacter sp. A2]NPE22229.1 hypothetical protein [Fusibacter sp. A1]RXV61003.1 hypothetical protein DWB64_10315 [Fusibacter sp. A1]
MERSKLIFDNKVEEKTYRRAVKSKKRHLKKFGDDSMVDYPLTVTSNEVLEPFIGVNNLSIGSDSAHPIDEDKGIIIGNIRMGFGHYRISMAIASAANAMGYTPYWFDLHAFKQTTGGKVIAHLNNLYSMGSRWSTKYPLFNKVYWEPLNSEGFKKLSFNAADQKTAELMTPVFGNLPKQMPFIATHVWPAQAAVHAGMDNVVNVIPDNWPMALHLAEGSIHTVQTPSSYFGYKTLKGMNKKQVLNPIPSDALYEVGHYIDHELVKDLNEDCDKRLARIQAGKAKRILLTVGGAGAQQEIFIAIVKQLIPLVQNEEVTLFVNVGDHKSVWDSILQALPVLKEMSLPYFDDWQKTTAFAEAALSGDVKGVHAFYHEDIFAAVYASNLLMRASDLLVTKPSELSFYPVPKLLIKRVGGHEAWGAVRSSEVGDGTIECETEALTLQMLDLLLKDEDMLEMMVNNIKKAHLIGTYNGAYQAVSLATTKKLQK